MPRGIEHSLPVNVPVSLRTRRNYFLIHWFLGERLAMPRGIEHSRSVNVPVSLRTRRNWFFIHWFLREKLAMPGGMDCEHTSEFA